MKDDLQTEDTPSWQELAGQVRLRYSKALPWTAQLLLKERASPALLAFPQSLSPTLSELALLHRALTSGSASLMGM